MTGGTTGTDETYRRAWQAAPLAILTLDQHTRIRGCNPASERLFARPLQELVGQPMAMWCHALDRGALRQMLAEALTGRIPARQEIRFTRPDGNEIVAGFSTAPTREGDGGVVCILRDLSSEKAFRPQLPHTERMASIGTVASVVAHELNNALAGAFGCLQLLPRQGDPGAQELLDAVMGELRRAAEIVRELKGYARVEDGMNELVRVDELVERLRRLWRYHHASGRTPALEVSIPEALPELRGNGNHLLQALLNLVRNAEQAVAGLPDERQPIAIRGRAEGSVLVLEVADRGPGVPVALRSRLFEPFYSTKPAGDGTGLGLTVVQAVAAGHGGRVEVDDTPGGGATFRLVLPLPGTVPAAEPELPPAGTGGEPHRRLAGVRMLVADDEPLLRRVIERAAAAEGMVVTGVGGADEAKQALRTHPFELVLLDVRMPGGGGAEVFRAIELEHPRLVPRTVFMSGEITTDMHELVGRGHGGVLPKPFDLHALLDTLDGVLARAGVPG